jgi:replicative superfamily II helicase
LLSSRAIARLSDAEPSARRQPARRSTTALRDWLVNDRIDTAQAVREFARRHGNGLLLGLIEAVLVFAVASRAANTRAALQSADPTFTLPVLEPYLDKLRRPTLFPAQLRAIARGATQDVDRVVSLPTSSGKTFLAELRIVATLARHPGSRALYVAPYRLLARQIEREFRPGLNSLHLTVRDLGSGYDPTVDLNPDGDHDFPDVVVCTPERLDALLRLSSQDTDEGVAASALLESLGVLVFDELQLVGREGRGPRFELLLTRLRWRFPTLRILGLCAASRGIDELASWLSGAAPVTGARRPTGTLELVWDTDGKLVQRAGSQRRAVGDMPRTGKPVDDAAGLVLRFGPSMQPVLVVETTRPLAENIARTIARAQPLAGQNWRDALGAVELRKVDEAVAETRSILGKDHPLADLIQQGVAFHHAGVPMHVLRHVERLASERLLRVLCATTTVAEGADLPFKVVVIPHLNFPGGTRRLERDLYMNIIGRAGRANVAMEGLVFILNSDATTLNQIVRSSLWSDTQADRVQGRLAAVSPTALTLSQLDDYDEVRGQCLAWLGEGGGGLPDQAETLASRTFSFVEGDRNERGAIARLMASALIDLETHGLARAASPLRLTELGRRVRLGGLAPLSAVQLNAAVVEQQGGWLASLTDARVLTRRSCDNLAALVMRSGEVLVNSLWMRRLTSQDEIKSRVLQELFTGRRRWPVDDEVYEADVNLLSMWLQGASFESLANAAPPAKSAQALFGGKDVHKQVSDAADYIGRLTYAASWTWSAARVLLGDDMQAQIPGFIRQSLEYGVPSETATHLVHSWELTREGAMLLSGATSGAWDLAKEALPQLDEDELASLGLSQLDRERVSALQDWLEGGETEG